ncbi:MAG: ISKra4 family transposase [Bryobacteraceae bacterium]|nr:ISKra4 family transposase [Bryobacteraceae bacterium]
MMPQEHIAAKSQDLHRVVDELLTIVSDAVQEQTPIHEVESKAFKTLLRAGRATVQLLVDCLGDGDVGKEHELPDGTKLQRSAKPEPRLYTSIFGKVDIERYVYAEREGQAIQFVAIDARLALPESKFSYLLQDWDQNFVMEQPFGNVKKTVQRILELNQHVDSLERMNREMAKQVEAFHVSQTAPPAKEEGEILVQTADGKGVLIRRPADAPPITAHQHQPGPKPDRKKMATVGAVYSIDRFVRTPEEVVESLFRDPQQERPKSPRPRPCHKRMRAMLDHTDIYGDEIDGRAAIFGWIGDEMAARHAGRNKHKPIVCIMDGEEPLWNMRDALQEDVPMTDILDLLHVTPRVWDAASLFCPRDSDLAENFVRERVLRILRGEVDSVVRGLRRMGTVQGFRGAKLAKLQTICGFFEKNRHRMCYDEYLALGYPIASGVIEGACRHIVKDRLERTGMNWTVAGAQAMLDLRCIYLTEQWEPFIAFRIDRETARLYPYRHTLAALPWDVAA